MTKIPTDPERMKEPLRDKNGLSWCDKRDKIILDYFGFIRKKDKSNPGKE